MKAEILSIGTELTSGQSLDTNSQWLSQRLAELGIVVGWHTTIADDLDDNVQAFRIATERARLVVATGGLGPTQDDLTRDVLAKLASVALVVHEPSLKHVEEMFARRGRTMPERNRVQAYFPAGAEPIPNPLGTAPGILLTVGHCLIAALPGVPSEMRAMYEEQLRPRLLTLGLGGGIQVVRKLSTFGAGESAVEEKIADLTARGHVPEVGITAGDATIALRIFARAASLTEAAAQIVQVEMTIRQRLGNLVFGADEDELQDAVVHLLEIQHKTVATAESVTAGMVAHRLARVPGASAWLRGGIVAYDNRVKVEQLGVPQHLLDNFGAVSAPVAEAMAIGCRTRLHTDYGVGTVGLAGPGGATPDKPIGLVYVAVAWDGGVRSASFNWVGTREEIQSRTAKLALNTLRLQLLEMPT